jgi:hypothetical protein
VASSFEREQKRDDARRYVWEGKVDKARTECGEIKVGLAASVCELNSLGPAEFESASAWFQPLNFYEQQ